MKKMDLELFKDLLKSDELNIHAAIVKKLSLADDRSVLRVTVSILPEQIDMIVKMSWDAVGPDAGIFQFPSINDLVLVGFLDGHEDDGFVLRRLTSKEDKIPLQAVGGHLAMRALAGKKAHLISDTNVLLGRGGSDPTERLVLGDTFKTAYSEHLQVDATHTHIGNLGYPTDIPIQTQDYLDIKASPVDDDAMLSDLSKTEK